MDWNTVARLSPHMDQTRDGYVVVRDVTVARTGTQIYWGWELPGVEPDATGTVHVLRDAADVFEPESLRSFNGQPITDGHPDAGMVGPDNWSGLSLGYGANARRGTPPNDDVVVADLILTTRKGLDLVRAGRRAISIGYTADYQQAAPGVGRQTNIRANHIALVDEGRCGVRCVIQDGRTVYSDAFMQRRREGTMRTHDALPTGYDPTESETGRSPTAVAKYPVGGRLIMRLTGDLSSYYVGIDAETGSAALFQTVESDAAAPWRPAGSDGGSFRPVLDRAFGRGGTLAGLNKVNEAFWQANGGYRR
jgi:hypothetical protein